MDTDTRIEQALEQAMAVTLDSRCPPGLAKATRHAVFPGGARVRPRLCLAVAQACGDSQPQLSDSAATAIELLHCASLVHDDLPCFDDASLRRGAPSVHEAYGERLAVLVGDGLIVLAFETLANGAVVCPQRLPGLMQVLAQSVGLPSGIVAGQAMECESDICLADYHRAKTGALFGAATMLGAAAAGMDPGPWRALGDHIGHAYQIVDDIRDATHSAEQLGKPCRQDERLGRPSSVKAAGVAGARHEFECMMSTIVASVPECSGAAALRSRIVNESRHFFPSLLSESAA